MNVPNNPTDLKALRQMITEASNHKTMIESNQEAIKEIAESAKDQFEMKKSHFNKLVNLYHRQNVEQFVGETEEIKDAYDSLFKVYDNERE